MGRLPRTVALLRMKRQKDKKEDFVLKFSEGKDSF